MKRNRLLLSIFLFTEGITQLMAQNTFQTTYGSINYDFNGCIGTTMDGGYIATGFTQEHGATAAFKEFTYLIRLDSFGDTIWTKAYSRDSLCCIEGSFVRQTFDGGFILTGSTSPNNSLILKTDANGIPSWCKTYSGVSIGYIEQTTDSGYILPATTRNASFDNYFLIKLDENGNILWKKTYGGNGFEVCSSGIQTLDGGYILVGGSDSFSPIQPNNTIYTKIYIVKTNALGDTLWTKIYGDINSLTIERAIGIEQMPDSSFIVTGDYEFRGFLMKLDMNGNIQWANKINPTSINNTGLICKSDGGFVCIGRVGVSNPDILLLKVDSSGSNILFSQTYGGIGWETGSNVLQTNDRGFIIGGGTSNSFGNDSGSVYLIKTDSLGNSGCNETTLAVTLAPFTPGIANTSTIVSTANVVVTNIAPIVEHRGNENILCRVVGIDKISKIKLPISIYPNPFTSELNIDSKEKGEIILYDITGKQVFRKTIFEMKSKIDTGNISAGFYLLQFSNGKRTEYLKVLKL